MPAQPRSTNVTEASEARSLRTLCIILLVGALVRALLWGWFADLPPRIWDENDYNTLAVNLVEYGSFGFTPEDRTSLRPPLYPTFVAGVYWLFGVENYQAVRLFQAVFSLANVLVLYGIGAALGSRRVGLWAAGLFCFYPSLLIFNKLILTETLFTLLLCGACYTLLLFYRREHVGYLVGTGVLLGLAALTRSVVWMSFPCLAAFLLLTWHAAWRRRIIAAVTVCLAFAVTLAPWAIRNTCLQRTFVAVDCMGGRNFMMGNYRYTPFYRAWDAIAIEGEQSWDREVTATYSPAQRDSQGKMDKLALRQGVKFVCENPVLTLERDIIKFFDFWGLERELVSGAGHGFFGDLPGFAILLLAAAIFGSYAAVMTLGVFGIVLAPLADRRGHWLLLCVIAYVCGMHTLVFAHSRYHLAVMPLMIVFAASALVNCRRVWQQRGTGAFWVCGVACVGLMAGWLWALVAGDLERFLSVIRSAG